MKRRGRYVLSPRAQADIDEIWTYTFQTWGTKQAETYVRGIESAIETVAASPRNGRKCDAIRTGYFKYAAGSHMLFYRLAQSGIEIVRILHQRMDFNHHL